jgi:hypothetical protein
MHKIARLGEKAKGIIHAARTERFSGPSAYFVVVCRPFASIKYAHTSHARANPITIQSPGLS